jgi:hypothetical protein
MTDPLQGIPETPAQGVPYLIVQQGIDRQGRVLQQPGFEIRGHPRLAGQYRFQPERWRVPGNRLAEAEPFTVRGLDGIGQRHRHRLRHRRVLCQGLRAAVRSLLRDVRVGVTGRAGRELRRRPVVMRARRERARRAAARRLAWLGLARRGLAWLDGDSLPRGAGLHLTGGRAGRRQLGARGRSRLVRRHAWLRHGGRAQARARWQLSLLPGNARVCLVRLRHARSPRLARRRRGMLREHVLAMASRQRRIRLPRRGVRRVVPGDPRPWLALLRQSLRSLHRDGGWVDG